MARCPNCGAELEKEQRLCPECGAEIPPRSEKKNFTYLLFHPLSMLGLLVVVSLILALVHFSRREPFASSTEEPKKISQLPAPSPQKQKGKILKPADKKYLEILEYEKKLNPLMSLLDQLNQKLSLERKEITLQEWQELRAKLEEEKNRLAQFSAPPGIGPCQTAMKNSLDQCLRAVNALWNYQNTKAQESLGAYRQSISQAKSQKDYCQSLIEIIKKQLEPSLSRDKAELEEKVFGKPVSLPEQKPEKEPEIKEEKTRTEIEKPSPQEGTSPKETEPSIEPGESPKEAEPAPQEGESLLPEIIEPSTQEGETLLPEPSETPGTTIEPGTSIQEEFNKPE